MNKKVFTLCAGLLLAGGAFFSANAQDQAAGLYEVADQGTYHFVKFDDRSAVSTPDWTSWNMTVEDGKLIVKDDNEPSAANLWKVAEVKSNNVVIGFSLVNGDGVKLSFDKEGKFVKDGNGVINCFRIEDAAQGLSLYSVGSEKRELKQQGDRTLKLEAVGTNSDTKCAVFHVYPKYMSAENLNKVHDGGFALQICAEQLKNNGTEVDYSKAPVEYASLQGNPFVGKLAATTFTTMAMSGVTLKNEAGKQIILTSEKWGNLGAAATVTGFKFKAVTEAELKAMETAGKVKASVFNIAQPVGYEAPLEVSMMIGSEKYELIVVEVNGSYYLTVAKSLSVSNVSAIEINKADYTFASGNNQNTYVKFGVSNAIDNDIFIGKVWNIYMNGKIASPINNEYVATTQVAAAYPEGQWLWDDEAEEFTNRETGRKITWSSFKTLRKTDKADTYTSGVNTYQIVAAGDPSDKATLGYLNGYSDDVLKQKAFFIGAPVEATGDTIYLSKAAKGVLKFTKDKNDAVEFRLTVNPHDKDHKAAQVRTTYTAWKDKAKGMKVQKDDIVSLLRYDVTEAVSGDVLAYDYTEERYVLSAKDDLSSTIIKEYSLIFKNKSANTYNIVRPYSNDVFYTTVGSGNNEWHKANFANFHNGMGYAIAGKLYGAFNVSELVQIENLYRFVQNDQFVIVDAAAQQYRGDFSESKLDTIKVFRNVDDSYVMYEQGALLAEGKTALAGFLGMENFNDSNFAEKNAALLADTAFHANTYRPQYMLAVGTKAVPAGKVCPIHGDDPTCPDAHKVATKGYITGRYLVNLVDSAKAATKAGVKDANNKYIYQQDLNGKPYYRLGFVQAKHEGDSLMISATKDTIDLKNAGDKVCAFAFKYTDKTREAFTIETLYDVKANGTPIRGYVKYHNGKLVVTQNAIEAEVFNLAELKGVAPTANETIATSDVTVSATNGAVVVKGAAGKAVVVTNILGQTLANAVISSDNASISVPAGIVVVAVEGEEAVKVVVK